MYPADILSETAVIAEQCGFSLDEIRYQYPDEFCPDHLNPTAYLRHLVEKGMRQRWPDAISEKIRKQIQHELSLIEELNYEAYFLTVYDIVRFARSRNIFCQGRGSAANSVVCFCLGITEVDPARMEILFERFISRERNEPPDIDIDFCMRRRSEVIEYVARKYGHDKVAHIITFGTMAAKAAIRDVGRVLEMSFGDVDRIAKMIPPDLGATIADAIASNADLRQAIEDDEQVSRLVALAEGLEGQVRHASTHAAGVVISDEPLTNYVPLYKAPGGKDDTSQLATTQFPMNDVEAIGLLKMDFLGLRTLTLVHDALLSISKEKGKAFTVVDIPLDDEKTYRMFAKGNTSGIFQFESSGMREYLKKLKPTELNDLIAMNALYRPGPIGSGMIDEYIQRKHDPSQVAYELPQLEEVLRETYGVIVYQEQVMRIAAALAGFSLGEADILRKAMGKKNPEVMASMERQFLDGCEARAIPASPAKRIWDLIVEFAAKISTLVL